MSTIAQAQIDALLNDENDETIDTPTIDTPAETITTPATTAASVRINKRTGELTKTSQRFFGVSETCYQYFDSLRKTIIPNEKLTAKEMLDAAFFLCENKGKAELLPYAKAQIANRESRTVNRKTQADIKAEAEAEANKKIEEIKAEANSKTEEMEAAKLAVENELTKMREDMAKLAAKLLSEKAKNKKTTAKK